MRLLLLLALMTNFLYAFNCEVVDKKNQSILKKCTHNSKELYAISLKADSFKQISYDHGYLLADQTEEGSLSEAIGNINMLLEQASKIEKPIYVSILNCLKTKFNYSLTQEFKDGMDGLYGGLRDKKASEGKKPAYSSSQFKTANYSIEYANVLGGLLHDLDQSKLKGASRIIRKCGLNISTQVLYKAIKYLSGVNKSGKSIGNKFACSGATASSRNTNSGDFIHIRNLEQTTMMKTWNNAPVIFMVKQKNKIPYVAFGTAGMIFPGGISGFNEEGITVSLHQLNSESYKLQTKKGQGYILPFLQQKILSDAKSIDEAIAIVKKAKVFSSWIILIGDAKNDESATIEVSSEDVVVSQRKTNKPVAISNHFLSKQMQKHHFHKSMSYYMETSARFSLMNYQLKKYDGVISDQFMVDLMANHYDVYAKENRLFGRSLARASNIMTTMAIPTANMAYITLADHESPNHGTYLGFKVNFSNGGLLAHTTINPSIPSKYKEAVKYYVIAYREYNVGDKKLAIPNLEKANKILKSSDPHVLYVLGKLYIAESQFDQAKEVLGKASGLSSTDQYLSTRISILEFFVSNQVDSLSASVKENIYSLLKSELSVSKVFSQYKSRTGYNALHGQTDLENRMKLLEKIYNNEATVEDIGGVDLSSID